MTTEPTLSDPHADEAQATAELIAFDSPTVPALATEQPPAVDAVAPARALMVLRAPDPLPTNPTPEPLIWPVPWRAEDAAPWWWRAWAHAQGAWIGTALAALLVLGLLGAGMALHLTPPSRTATTTAQPAPHTTITTTPARKTTTTTTPLAAKPAAAPHLTQQPPSLHSGSSGHGHKHK